MDLEKSNLRPPEKEASPGPAKEEYFNGLELEVMTWKIKYYENKKRTCK